MTRRTDIQSLEGATISISAELPVTYNSAGYTDTGIDWTAIGKVENYGNHGVKATMTTFTPVDTGVTEKVKGSKDYGSMNLVLGDVPSDAGQVIIAAAAESKAHYSIKIQYALGDGEVTAETHYLDVLVMSYENQDGAVNDTRKRNVELAICKAPVVVDAT